MSSTYQKEWVRQSIIYNHAMPKTMKFSNMKEI